MKKMAIYLLVILVLLSGCASNQVSTEPTASESSSEKSNADETASSTEASEPIADFSTETENEDSTEADATLVESASLVDKPVDTPNSMSEITQEETVNTVSISVLNGEQAILNLPTVELLEGDTVFSVFLRSTKENKVHFDYSGKGSSAYVKAIGNVYEFDEGPESGWMFSVNGVFPKTGCGTYKLNVGDVVVWFYTKNMGTDIGASLG